MTANEIAHCEAVVALQSYRRGATSHERGRRALEHKP